MKFLNNAVVALVLLSLSSFTMGQDFKITKLMQGKLRVIDNKWDMYNEGKKFDYLPNDVCEYGDRIVPCMTHGIAIRYETNLEAVTLECVSASGKPKSESRHEIKLVGSNNIHVEPSFFYREKPPSKPYKQRIKCYWNGKKVIDYNFKITSNPGDTWETTGKDGTKLYDSEKTGLACRRSERQLVAAGAYMAILADEKNNVEGDEGVHNKAASSLMKQGLEARETCSKGRQTLLEKGALVKVIDSTPRECGTFVHVTVADGSNVGLEGCILENSLKIP